MLEAVNVDLALPPTESTPQPQLRDDDDKNAAGLLVSDPDKTLEIVSVCYQKTKAGIGQLLDEWQENAENHNDNAAYVVTNDPKYPFADIVVAVPGKALFLIQCKDHSQAPHTNMVEEELRKMGCLPTTVVSGTASNEDAHKLLKRMQKCFRVEDAQTVFLFMGRTRDDMAETKKEFPSSHWGGRVEFAAMDSLAQPFRDMIPFIPRAAQLKRVGEAHDRPLFVSMYDGDTCKAKAALERFGEWKKKLSPSAST